MGIYTNQKHFRNSLLLLGSILLGAYGQAQYSPAYYQYKKEYPDASKVCLNQETTLELKLRHGNIEVTRHVLQEDLYMVDPAAYSSKQSLDFSSFYELEDIDAASYLFEKNDYERLKVDKFTTRDRLDHSFHDDAQTVSYIYPNLRKGSKTKLEYSEKITDPRFLTSFYFANFYPIINNKVTITTDKAIDLDFKKFNLDSLNLKFSEEERHGRKIYTWQLKNSSKVPYESNAPTYQKILPHIIPIISSFKVNHNTVSVLKNVDDLYSWYYTLTENLNTEPPSPEMVAVVKKLTKGKTNDLEKVKAIYYWVQKNIKYIAFEYALGGFVPREANAVFQKKYGDCKDNSSILQQMLSIAGIKGNLTWIGTRDISYKYTQVPTPAVDNHMILTFHYQGKRYFLDATGRYLPIDLPSVFIQGKEALIGNGKDDYKIVDVPVIPAGKNTIQEKMNVHLEGDTLVGSSRARVSGYFKTDMYNFLENKTKAADIKSFYNQVYKKGSNKFLITALKEENKYDYDKDFLIDYDFNVQDYAKKLGGEIYLNLNLTRSLSTLKTEKDREIAVEYEFKKSFDYQTTLTIPEGYTVEYMPKPIEVSNQFCSGKIDYAQTDGKITYHYQFQLNALDLDLAQQKVVNSSIETMEKGFKEIIILQKK